MTFSDIFKSSFLKNVTSVSVLDMVLALGLAFAIGLFIFLIYRKTYAGVMYSSSFGVTLVGLTMISTFVILAVTSNVVLSLGMVGALSIVRFRTAIKEPLDITFLFWAIAAGIVLAAGMIPLAVLGSVFIGLVLLVFANKKSHVAPYMVVLHCANQDAEKHAMDFLQTKVKSVSSRARPSGPMPWSSTPKFACRMKTPALSMPCPRSPALKAPFWSATTASTWAKGDALCPQASIFPPFVPWCSCWP